MPGVWWRHPAHRIHHRSRCTGCGQAFVVAFSCKGRGSTGIACRLETSQGCSRRITDCEKPSPHSPKGNVCKLRDAATGGHAVGGYAAEGCCDTHEKPRSHDTSRIAWAKLMARVGGGVSARVPSVRRRHPADRLHQSRGRSGRFSHTSANRSSHHRCRPLVARPPTGANSSRPTTTAMSFKRRIDELPAIDIHSL